MKSDRQLKILEIIKSEVIETQEELTARLVNQGYKVTQATISRDIKELRILKVSDEKGRYRYASDVSDGARARAKYQNIIEQTVIHTDYANNLVVIKTFAGMAQAAGAAIDAIEFSGTLGCIAGDDTILLIARDLDTAHFICDKIKEIISNR